MRKITELKDNWFFVKNAEDVQEATAAEGTGVLLPHTWNALDGQDGGNDYHRGTCWYRRLLEKPELEAGEKAYLEFDGAAMTADVYLNGEKPGSSRRRIFTVPCRYYGETYDGGKLNWWSLSIIRTMELCIRKKPIYFLWRAVPHGTSRHSA
mgnify:CR=1 FL=1